MGDRSSLLRSKRNPKALGYSTFDPGGSIDSGLSRSTDANRKSRANDASERVSISWENIQVFVEQPGPSFLKRLCTCFGTKENEIPTSKQVLFNGRWIFRMTFRLVFAFLYIYYGCIISHLVANFQVLLINPRIQGH